MPPKARPTSAGRRSQTASPASVAKKDNLLQDSDMYREKPCLPLHETRKCPNLYSQTELMRHLSDYLCDCVIDMGCKENNTSSNIRIIVTGIACTIAIYASIFLSVPKQRISLGAIVAMFCLLIGTLEAYTYKYYSSHLISITTKSGKRLEFGLAFNRKTAEVTFTISEEKKLLTSRNYIGDFFDVDGMMVTDAVFCRLKEMLLDAEKGLFDSTKELLEASEFKHRNTDTKSKKVH